MSQHDVIRLPSDEEGLIPVEITRAAAAHAAAWMVDARLTAAHESGHILAASLVHPPIPVVAVDITGKGASGHVETAEDADDLPVTVTYGQLINRVCMALAGGEAERILVGQRTNGSKADLQNATSIVAGIFESGMDEEVGLISVSGLDYGMIPDTLKTARYLRTCAILGEQRERAARIIEERRDTLIALASIVHARRRITDEALDEVLRSVGLEPAPRGTHGDRLRRHGRSG